MKEGLGHCSQTLSGIVFGAVCGYASILEGDVVGFDDGVEGGHVLCGSVEVLEGEPHQRMGIVGDGPSITLSLEDHVQFVPVREGVSGVDEVAVFAS